MKNFPDRRIPQRLFLHFEPEYDLTPEPLPQHLVDFLTRYRVIGKVSPEMLWPIDPQIEGLAKTEFSQPGYRKPYAEIDCTPEQGFLPRVLTHFSLCPNRKDWFYLIALFFDASITEREKIKKILARLNEKPSL